MFFDKSANDIISDYLRGKIRSTVNDPVVAEKLIASYAYGAKRQPLDTNYYETYNKRNVLLVDAKADGPIEEITEKGIRAGGKEYEIDIIWRRSSQRSRRRETGASMCASLSA
jgi:cation diffusion facilitator CzcD-associated flavoprotein CzcO